MTSDSVHNRAVAPGHLSQSESLIPSYEALAGPPQDGTPSEQTELLYNSTDDPQRRFKSMRTTNSNQIPRKAVGSSDHGNGPLGAQNPQSKPTASILTPKPPKNRNSTNIYWVTPVAAVLLFLLGLGIAIGHHVFLNSLDEKAAKNQVWTNRYSLAMAFVFKTSLAASISIALAQQIWLSLQRSKRGISISAIDALFLVETSPLNFFSIDMWRSALIAAIMAAAIWLTPLTALISPTALTVGYSVFHTPESNCSVPVLHMSVIQSYDKGLIDSLALSTVEYTGTYFEPSIIAKRLVGSTMTNGRQIGWPSPCGANCTYQVKFVGPSWNCTRTAEVDDPRAPWRSELGGSYWYFGQYGDGSNITLNSSYQIQDDLLYANIYSAGLNNDTNQFWIGTAEGFTGRPAPDAGQQNQTLKEVLNVHVYYCQTMNTSYTLRVDYMNNIQTNSILDVTAFDNIDIPPQAWEGMAEYGKQGYEFSVPATIYDTVSLYKPLIATLTGGIVRSPQEGLVANTSLGLIPTLVNDISGPVTYGLTEPYLPIANLGPLLEELSHNVTISLMSDPRLQVTNTTKTTCYTSRTLTVWKYRPMPLVIAYACGLGANLLALAVGAYALISTGVAHDKSFSSIVRTTRHRELDVLCSSGDSGALPLDRRTGRRRLLFSEGFERMGRSGKEWAPGAEGGFRLLRS